MSDGFIKAKKARTLHFKVMRWANSIKMTNDVNK